MALLPCAAQAAVFVDDFADNVRGPQWTEVVDDASLTLSEASSRLNVLANAPANPNFDAIYLSNGPAGFRLSTAADFSLAIDYSFNAATPVANAMGSLGLVFGVGRDEEGTDSAAIGFIYSQLLGQTTVVVTRTDDVQTFAGNDGTLPNTGRFAIAYRALTDELALGTFVGGEAKVVGTLTGVVRGVWGADDLLVSFGAHGAGYSTSFGNAYFDNFAIEEGVLVPEPSAMMMVGASAIALLAGRRRRLG